MAKRTDANQTEIVQVLRKMGALVLITSNIGKGAPDLVVGIKNKLYMIEIKDGSKPKSAQKLTPLEELFHSRWYQHIRIINSVEQAVDFVCKES